MVSYPARIKFHNNSLCEILHFHCHQSSTYQIYRLQPCADLLGLLYKNEKGYRLSSTSSSQPSGAHSAKIIVLMHSQSLGFNLECGHCYPFRWSLVQVCTVSLYRDVGGVSQYTRFKRAVYSVSLKALLVCSPYHGPSIKQMGVILSQI